MHKFAGTVLTFILISLGATPVAYAQEFVPAPRAVYLLDFDTEAGAFSSWGIEDITGLDALAADVTFVRKGKDKKWSPGFTIAIESGSSVALLKGSALPKSGPLFIQTMAKASGVTSQEDFFYLPPDFGEEFKLLIQWTPEGKITFFITSEAMKGVSEYERHEIQLAGPPDRLSISVSTGEVTFMPLALGNMVTPTID